MPARWFRVRPRVGVKESVLPLVGSYFVLEAHKREGKLDLYYYTFANEASLNPVAAVEQVDEPPELPRHGAEIVRDPDHWWRPITVADWPSVYRDMPPGTVVQVVGLLDYKLKERLVEKARAFLTGQDTSASRMLAAIVFGETAFQHRKDPKLGAQLESEALESVYQLAVRVYADDKNTLREALDQVLARIEAEGLETTIFKAKDPRKLRDPTRLKKGDRRRLWLTRRKLGAILRLPDPSLVPIDFARGAPLPAVVPRRSEIRVGVLEDGREVRIDIDDLYRHGWVIGRTGAGKSTFLVNLALRLWEAGRGLVVVIDPHGDLARDIVEAAPSLDHVYYLEPERKPFGVNPLDLPRLEDEQLARSLVIDNTVAILEKALRLPETAVNVKLIVATLLGALYDRTRSPTLGQLFDAIVALYRGELELESEDPLWRTQVELLRELSEQSFVSALARLRPFATHPLLRRVTSRTTIDLDKWVEERALVAIAVPKAYGEAFSELLTSVLVLKLWFYVLERAVAGRPRTPIFVIIDEFQNVAGLPVIETILSEARKYGLHLILAHQHTKQLPEELLQSILTNTALKVVFAVEGPDVGRIKSIDPDFAEEVRRVLPSLTVGTALIRIQARPGEEPYPPLLVKTDPPPSKRRRLEDVLDQLPSFEPPTEEQRDVRELLNPVLRYLPEDRLDPLEQLILYHVYTLQRERGGDWVEWSNVLVRLGVSRKRADEARDRLAAQGYLEAVKEGNRWVVRYVKGLFTGLKAVAPSKEGLRIARRAVLYYIEKGYYVVPARQDPSLAAKPDLVAIPFDRSTLSLRYSEAVAVEVESCNEVETHPEQVARNVEKHASTPFREVHVWFPKRCIDALQRALSAARKPKPLKLYPVRFREQSTVEEEEEPSRPEAGGEEAAPTPETLAAGKAGGAEETTAETVEETTPVLKAATAEHETSQPSPPASPAGHGLEYLARVLERIVELQERSLAVLERLEKRLEGLEAALTALQHATGSGAGTETGKTESEGAGKPRECVELVLDEPPGETVCLEPDRARRAEQLRHQGYRLHRSRTGRIYAQRGTSRIPL